VTRTGQGQLPLLFLIGDTGGGHRSAAKAVREALHGAYPGRFEPIICDPLHGEGVPLRLRWMIGLYGPCIRLTPWFYALLWRGFGSDRVFRWARRTLLSPSYPTVAAAVAAHRPAAIVAFHPMTTEPAVLARELIAPGVPVITVITDLVTTHLAWRDAPVDRIIVPSAPVGRRCALDGLPEERYLEIGIPVAADFVRAPLQPEERRELRRSLGLSGRFLVVMTGGAEGSGGLYRRAAAILGNVDDVDVAVICGRNRSLRRSLGRLAGRAGGRLTVLGYVDNMADWLRCAELVVGKAGPGTIAEATCCAAPLVLTSHVPGQEEGNIEFVVQAGAGRYAATPRDLAAVVASLRDNPAALAAMRSSSGGLSRPDAATDIAGLLADIASQPGSQAGLADSYRGPLGQPRYPGRLV